MSCSCADFCASLRIDNSPSEEHAIIWRQQYGSSLCLPPLVFFGSRLTLLLAWLAISIWSLASWADYAPMGYWFTKLTHWGLALELAYFAFAAFTTGIIVLGKDETQKSRRRPWFVVVTQVLQDIILPISFMIFLMYWTLVFSGTIFPVSIATHGINFLLVVVDQLINRQPLRLLSIIFPAMFSLVYLVFTLIYYAAGGTFEDGESPYIYEALNWENPTVTGTMAFVIVVIVTPLVYLLMVGCYRLEVLCDQGQRDFVLQGVGKSTVATTV
mmetsp:Transcript_21020/g.62169  ORF Transcript_21020/g.62169 Transcript_21020/m.62169 type:complete len:271 (-) Transcript_21020:258-1070(-)